MARVSDERALWIARHILPHEPALRAWLGRRRAFDLDIDDIVQETYARLASVESVADVRNPKAYFFQAAHSIVASHVRRAQIISIRAVEDVELLGVKSERASPEEVVSDREELHHIAEIIAAMPRHLAAVFALRRIEGLSQRETAERLGVSESTVEKHMGKSLRLFMDALGRGGNFRAHASKSQDEAQKRHAKTRDEP